MIPPRRVSWSESLTSQATTPRSRCDCDGQPRRSGPAPHITAYCRASIGKHPALSETQAADVCGQMGHFAVSMVSIHASVNPRLGFRQ